jgi:molybdopterin-guanine dinucleotide biosynthesis protein A
MNQASGNREKSAAAPVIGLLLAGGRARRMGGGDKCLLTLHERPLLAHVIDRLGPQVSALVINANGDPARFSEFGLPVVRDPVEGFAGPLAGVLAGMLWARANRPDAEWVVTAATDTPFFPADLVARLLAATAEKYPAIALSASGGRQHPVFGLWPTALAGDLDDALRRGTRKVLDWTAKHPTFSVEFETISVAGETVDPFFNANRPEDLAKAEVLWEQIAS